MPKEKLQSTFKNIILQRLVLMRKIRESAKATLELISECRRADDEFFGLIENENPSESKFDMDSVFQNLERTETTLKKYLSKGG